MEYTLQKMSHALNATVDGGAGTDTLRLPYYLAATSGTSINLAASSPNDAITVGSSRVTFNGIELFNITGTYYTVKSPLLFDFG